MVYDMLDRDFLSKMQQYCIERSVRGFTLLMRMELQKLSDDMPPNILEITYRKKEGVMTIEYFNNAYKDDIKKICYEHITQDIGDTLSYIVCVVNAHVLILWKDLTGLQNSIQIPHNHQLPSEFIGAVYDCHTNEFTAYAFKTQIQF